MRKTTCLAAVLLLTSCAGSAPITRGEKYVSPFGRFTCGPFTLNTHARAAFGPHGGTVRFVNAADMTRVDVEEFQPKLDASALIQNRELVYHGYLADQILPLVKSGVPNARLLDAHSSVINGLPVYQSAILMPGESGGISGDGKRIDGIRGQVQYTNGQYMYTVSVNSVAWPGRSNEQQIGVALSYAETVFKQCTFPEVANFPKNGSPTSSRG